MIPRGYAISIVGEDFFAESQRIRLYMIVYVAKKGDASVGRYMVKAFARTLATKYRHGRKIEDLTEELFINVSA